MERFNEADESDIKFFIDSNRSANTKLSTSNWLKIYQLWARARGKEINPEKLEPYELNKTLELFYAEVKKSNGKDYEPDSLRVMIAAVDRHLKEKDYPMSIMKDRAFASSKSVLEGKARQLRVKGMGKKPNGANSLTKEEEEILWQCGKFWSSIDVPLKKDKLKKNTQLYHSHLDC